MNDDNVTAQSWEEIPSEPVDEASGTEHDGAGAQEIVGNDSGGLATQDDSAGGADDIGVTSGELQRSLQSAGNTLGEGNGEQDGTVSDDEVIYEGVSSESFLQMYESFDAKLDALNASALVLVFAMFLCAGAVAVDTLLRSLEWKK